MARRILLWKLNHGLGMARLKIPSGSPLELSAGSFFRPSRHPAGCIVQELSERSYILSRVQRSAGVHVARRSDYAAQPTYGVGPLVGKYRDPRTEGDTPDDIRADELHAAVPKEITKEAAAKVTQEPPDFQSDKVVPEESKAYEGDAEPQRADEGKAFETKTRKQKGTAQYQGDTKGTEKSGHEVEGQYGAGPDEGKTTRS